MILLGKLFTSTESLSSSDFKLNSYNITQILTGIFKLWKYILSSLGALTLEALATIKKGTYFAVQYLTVL